jgi:hypothetical protein
LISGLRYPAGVNNERHNSLEIINKIAEELHIQLEAFYDKFGTEQRIRAALLAKGYITERLYFIGGPEIEYDMNVESQGTARYRTSINLGVGYDVNNNLLLEARPNNQINNSTVGYYGSQGDYDVFMIMSRVKC